jgi:pyridoxamine 5'-phosphate oxidase
MSDFISDTRIEYKVGSLDVSDVKQLPVEQFKIWFEQALKSEANEPNACALATAGSDGQPSVRMVLLKSYDQRGFVFFSNYRSRKGEQLAQNGRAALVFYWPNLERQVRIEGEVTMISAAESQAYFETRPRDSQLGSAVSSQSAVAGSREELERALEQLRQQVGERPVPRPDWWGGYRVYPKLVEFWQGRENRLHDRVRYLLNNDGVWVIERLWP